MKESKFIGWDADKAYSLVSGGLVYSLLKKLGIYKKGQDQLLWRSLLFSLFSWLPLIILSFTDGTFLGEDGEIGIAHDFLLHIRLLIIVPFLIWVENLIDPAFNAYMNTTRRLIPPGEEPAFKKAESETDKLSDSWVPEILFLIIIYGLLILNWGNSTVIDSRLIVTDKVSNINPTAIYYILISLPIYQFLLVRWLWRWIIWAITVFKFSKMNLRIQASHADQMAGLEYLTLVPMAFCIAALALSTMFSALIAEEIIYQNATLGAYKFMIIIFVITIPLLVHLPLFSFITQLIRAKVQGVTRFGSLIQFHNNLFKEKWMEGEMPANESILPSLDNSSMADINGSYQQAVKSMSIIPLNRNTLILAMIMMIIPFIPLIFTMYSFSELFSKLLGILTG